MVFNSKNDRHLLIVGDGCCLIGLIWIEVNDIRYPNETESHTFSGNNDFRWINCSEIRNKNILTICGVLVVEIECSYRQAKPAWCIARNPAVNCIMIAHISVSGKNGPFGLLCKLLLWLIEMTTRIDEPKCLRWAANELKLPERSSLSLKWILVAIRVDGWWKVFC